jgi:pimeloyl-ACP methyl ester carboxylesterase
MTVPLAILPGLLCDSRAFPGVAQAFPGAVLLDGFYPGAGTITAMAEQALQGLPPRFALLGHSMGARVALEVLRLAPERVERLALVDTGVHPVAEGEAEKRHALRDLGRREGIARLVDAWLPPMIGPARRSDAALVDALAQMACAAGQEGFERQIEALLARPDAVSVLAGIACPTFVIVGEDDAWSPVAQHREIAAQVPGSQLRIVPGAGHMLPTELPAAFHACIAEWLGWPDARGG